jgi:alpha-1,6-mannosyltransferase
VAVNETLGVTQNTHPASPRAEFVSRRSSRTYQLGLVGLLGVVTLGVLLSLAVAGTGNLLPESLRLGVASQFLGLLGRTGIYLPGGVLIAALLVLFFFYVLAVRATDQLAKWMVFSAIAVFVLIVLAAPPIVSTDVFSYQAYGRMYTIYGSNPYLHGPYSIYGDQLYFYIDSKWIATPSVYGPLFTLLSSIWAGPLRLSTSAIAASVFAYKTIAALAAVGTMALLWRCAKLRGTSPLRAVALFGLNPLVVFYGIGGGHNDLLELMLMTAGIYAVLLHRNGAGGTLVALSAGIKLTAGLVLPFALASGSEPDADKRRRSLLLTAAITFVLMLGIGLLAFHSGIWHLPSTLDQVQKEGAGQTVPGFISTILHLPTLGHIVGAVLGAIFIGVCVWLLIKVHRGELDWIEGAAWATLGLLVSTSSILPWYGAWLLPLVALSHNRKLWTVTFCFMAWMLATALVVYLPGSSFLGI